MNTGLDYLVGLRRLLWNPLSAVKPFHENHAKRGTLTVEEYLALLVLDGLAPRVHTAIALGGMCGMRLGEIRGLKWGDVDAEAGMIRIVRSYVEIDGERDQAKHGSNRAVPLPSPVAEALDAWRSESPSTEHRDWVVCDTDAPMVPMKGDDIREGYDTALGLVQIDTEARRTRGIVFHSLRYWYNTQLRGSIPENVLRRFTSHHSEEMTDLYEAGKEIDFQKARARLEELASPSERQASGKSPTAL